MFKCSKCGNEFEDNEDVVKVGKKYVCFDCCDDKTWWWCKLYEKVKEINNIKNLDIRQITILKKMNKEDKLTFAGMYYTLCYLQLIGKEPSEEYDLLGLIKYYYTEATTFWKAKWKLEDKVENLELKQKETIIKTKVVFKKEKEKHDLNFDFLEEREDDDK